MNRASPFQAVVFAGGGNRCLWQVGFWERVAPEIGLAPSVLAGVSAGAAMACAVAIGKGRASLEYFKVKTARNRSNFYPGRLFSGEPAFPHYDMYRRGLLDLLDEEALVLLRTGPEIRVLLTRPPLWGRGALGVLAGAAAYSLEKAVSGPIHPRYPTRLGFRPEVVRAADCQSSLELADLILASSCTPPVVPRLRFGGAPVLDGGLVDNVPLIAVEEGERPVLVLLTRRYRPERFKTPPDRVYLQPSRPVGIAKWDYTSPQGLQEAYDLGRSDGERFLIEGPEALQR